MNMQRKLIRLRCSSTQKPNSIHPDHKLPRTCPARRHPTAPVATPHRGADCVCPAPAHGLVGRETPPVMVREFAIREAPSVDDPPPPQTARRWRRCYRERRPSISPPRPKRSVLPADHLRGGEAQREAALGRRQDIGPRHGVEPRVPRIGPPPLPQSALLPASPRPPRYRWVVWEESEKKLRSSSKNQSAMPNAQFYTDGGSFDARYSMS